MVTVSTSFISFSSIKITVSSARSLIIIFSSLIVIDLLLPFVYNVEKVSANNISSGVN